MPKSKLRMLLLANLLTLGIHLDAEAITIMGARSCGEWVKNAQENGWPNTVQNAWLVGYLSGKANALQIDVLKDMSGESLILWMKNYCTNNPLERSFNAGDKLFIELIRRAGQ